MVQRDPARLVLIGRAYIDNAREASEQKILREEQLYVWENPLLALDEFIADSEDLAVEHANLGQVRVEARQMKTKLETLVVSFLGETFDEAMAVDVPTLLEAAGELYDAGAAALKEKADDATVWEEPLLNIKSWLADSEGHAGDAKVAAARKSLKQLRDQLQDRVEEFTKAWREADLKGGADDDE